MQDKNYRPILEKITKVNINNEDRDLILSWARLETMKQDMPISTRHILEILIREAEEQGRFTLDERGKK